MKVLVTGGTGFLGKSLAIALHRQGHAVTAAGRNERFGAELEKEGISFVSCHLEDTVRTVQSCIGQDMVFHCGAMSTLWGSYQDFYESNVTGTRNVIKGCLEGRVKRLIHVSTPSVYFDYKDRTDISETAVLPRKAANLYAETKRLAEREIDRAFEADGLPVITIRPRAIFGPGDQAIVPRLIEANRQGRLPLINGGQAVIDLTYIDNAVDSLILCMTAPASALGRKYNITNGEPVRFIEVLRCLFKRLGEPMRGKTLPYAAAYAAAAMLEGAARLTGSKKEPPLTRYAVGLLGKSQTLDITAARAQLGYSPAVTIKEGIERYAAWYRQQHV